MKQHSDYLASTLSGGRTKTHRRVTPNAIVLTPAQAAPKDSPAERPAPVARRKTSPRDIQLTGIKHAKEAIADLLNEQTEYMEREAKLVAMLRRYLGTADSPLAMSDLSEIDNDARALLAELADQKRRMLGKTFG